MKGNAIGSIFYGVGFSTPGVLAQAFTGNDGTTTTGRRLLQDPYHLTSKVALSVLTTPHMSWPVIVRLWQHGCCEPHIPASSQASRELA